MLITSALSLCSFGVHFIRFGVPVCVGEDITSVLKKKIKVVLLPSNRQKTLKVNVSQRTLNIGIFSDELLWTQKIMV